MEKQLKAKMRTRRPQISRRTFCVRCFTARSRVPDGVSPLLDTSRARWPRAQPFVHVHTFTECYTRNGSHDAWHACVARMTWRVCGSILISWWSGGYWATSQNSPYCCVSAHAPSPRFRPFVHPFRAFSTPPLVTPARPWWHAAFLRLSFNEKSREKGARCREGQRATLTEVRRNKFAI